MYATSQLKKKRSVEGQFHTGDVIAVELPGGGYALAAIGRLNNERMLCTSFSPRIEDCSDSAELRTWVPDGWSTWVVDTLGLRDGSWIKVDRPDAMAAALENIDIDALPRFKLVDKAGKKRFAEYDPDKLFVRTVVDAADSDEYETAPFYLPQDATTFEAALSNTLGASFELPDGDSVKQLNKEREVVALLRESITDLNVTLVTEHVIVFKKKRDAQKAQKELVERGLDVTPPVRSGWFGPYAIEVRLQRKAEYPLVREDVKRIRKIATYYGADYDGFGAQVL